MTLISTLTNLKGDFGSEDKAWVRFIKDHKDYILNNSTVTALSVADMLHYKYSPALYLESKDIHKSATWIFMLINQFNSAIDFVDLDEVFLPANTILVELKGIYNRSHAVMATADEQLA